VVVGGFVRVDLPLVWENAVEGDKRSVMNKVMAMRFKVSLLLLFWVKKPFWGPIVPKTRAAARMTPKHMHLVAS
jgi:hypothetical protein